MRHAIGRWKCAACLRASRQQSTLASAEASVPAASTSERPRLSYAPLSGPVQRYNALIDRYGDKGRLPAALQVAAQLKQTLLKLEEKPDTTTYEKLAKAFAVHGLYREAIRLIDDAMAAGVEPDVGVYNQVLRAHVIADQPLSPVFALMTRSHVEPNIYTRELVIQHYVHKRSAEAAVRALVELATDNVPTASTSSSVSPYSEQNLSFWKVKSSVFDSVLRLLCDVGETRLALDLVESYHKSALQPVSYQVLYDMVQAGITFDDSTCTWKAIQFLGKQNFNLSEGLAVAALDNLSKHGLVDACEEVYQRHLRPILDGYGGVQEWHLAPLVQVNITAGRLNEPIQYFKELESLPSRNAARVVRPSYRIFHMGLQHLPVVQQTLEHVQRLDQSRLEQLPIQLINALLKACGQHRLLDQQSDLAQRVLSRQENYPKPDLATFHILLESCLANSRTADDEISNTSKAQQILQTMRTDFSKIKPDHIIYELLIKLYLQGSDAEANLETAFDYLEEMKHFNMIPSPQIYTALLDRLMSITEHSDPPYDDARIDLLLQEMASLSYLGGKRQGYARTKLPTRLYEALGRERINQIRDNFFASQT